MESEQYTSPTGDIQARIEALLFVHGAPISIAKIASLISMSEKETREHVVALAKTYADRPESGLMVVINEDEVALRTKPAFAPLLETLAKEDIKEDLTPAALETLSLIAYFAPVSRAEIDYIRGVNSTYILRVLLIRGLIERQNQKNRYVYTPSVAMLSHMGIGTIEELPDYQRYRDLKQELYASESQTQEAPADDIQQEEALS